MPPSSICHYATQFVGVLSFLAPSANNAALSLSVTHSYCSIIFPQVPLVLLIGENILLVEFIFFPQFSFIKKQFIRTQALV
jgi:hypothetical protein